VAVYRLIQFLALFFPCYFQALNPAFQTVISLLQLYAFIFFAFQLSKRYSFILVLFKLEI
jgi:hypothetical protein